MTNYQQPETAISGQFINMHAYQAPTTARPLPEATYSHTSFLNPMYNLIMEYDPETDELDDYRCDLCREWEVSDDGATYTYRLHENIVWSDGTPFTAQDIIFTFDSIQDPDQFGDLYEGHKTHARSGMILPYYKDSRAIDDFTVEVNLNYPAAAWHSMLSINPVLMMPKHQVTKTDDDGKGTLQGLARPEDMVTSGPFRFVEFVKDVSVEFVRNPDYFKEGRPYIDGMKHFIIIDVGTIIAAFAAEEILMTNGNVDNVGSIESTQFREDYGDRYKVHFVGPAGRYNFLMNTEAKPFDSPLVRRAMNLAIHRQPIMDTLGVGDLTLGVPFPPELWYGVGLEEAAQYPGFRESEPGVKHPDDIAEAKRLLTEAGFPDGFEAELLIQRVVLYTDLGTLIAEQLRDFLGVDLTLNVMEAASAQQLQLTGEYQATMQGQSLPALDPDAAYVEYANGGLLGDIWGRGRNLTNWDKLQDLFIRQSAESDSEKRYALLREAEKSIVNEDMNLAGIYFSTSTFNIHRTIQNIHSHPSLYASSQKWEHIWCNPQCGGDPG